MSFCHQLDAARKKDFAKVIALVTTNHAYVNVQPGGQWSALHQAAQTGDASAVKSLLEHSTVSNLEGKTWRVSLGALERVANLQWRVMALSGYPLPGQAETPTRMRC